MGMYCGSVFPVSWFEDGGYPPLIVVFEPDNLDRIHFADVSTWDETLCGHSYRRNDENPGGQFKRYTSLDEVPGDRALCIGCKVDYYVGLRQLPEPYRELVETTVGLELETYDSPAANGFQTRMARLVADPDWKNRYSSEEFPAEPV
jgi:hypothetical protein